MQCTKVERKDTQSPKPGTTAHSNTIFRTRFILETGRGLAAKVEAGETSHDGRPAHQGKWHELKICLWRHHNDKTGRMNYHLQACPSGQVWEDEGQPLHMESGHAQANDEFGRPRTWSFKPEMKPLSANEKEEREMRVRQQPRARTAEWLQEELTASELWARQEDLPKGRPVKFNAELTKDLLGSPSRNVRGFRV